MNAPPGNFGAGERGLAALPGREKDFRQDIWRGAGLRGNPGLQANPRNVRDHRRIGSKRRRTRHS